MSKNPERIICKCGNGKVSAWDGKCSYCRTDQEKSARDYMIRSAFGVSARGKICNPRFRGDNWNNG